MWGIKILDGQSIAEFYDDIANNFNGTDSVSYVGIEERRFIPFTKPRVVGVIVELIRADGGHVESYIEKCKRLSLADLERRAAKIEKNIQVSPDSTCVKRLAAYRAAISALKLKAPAAV